MLTWPDTVSQQLADGVTALVEAAARADGVEPVSEDVRLRLRPGGSVAGQLLVAEAGRGDLAGLAYLGGDSTELLVHPDHRRRGIGSSLLAELRSTPTLSIWAHGDSPGAAALARRHGFTRDRVLWQLRRPLAAALPKPVWPAGVTVRTFEVGRDEPAWLAVNRRAFAHHPEQGRWDAADLVDRVAEAWFDPAGFFLAERGGELVGFHWTKVDGPIGEVYVVGVDPDAAGAGLGRALTLVGLHHLHQSGLHTVMLYVDDDNTAAVRLYQSLGFVRYACDVGYLRSSRS